MAACLRRLLTCLLLVVAIVPAHAAPRVLATIKPVQALAAAVMEGVSRPDLLIQGAASEHSYVLRPSDARKIADADIIFWIGPDLETLLEGPLRNLAPRARLITLEDAPGLIRLAARPGGLWGPAPASGPINPHLWLDIRNAQTMVRAMASVLENADPAHAARYRANAAAENARLSMLDSALGAELASVRNQPFVVFHDAYPYLIARYRLDALGTVTVEPGRPISPRRVLALRQAILSGRAVCLFREPQFPPALIETLSEGSAIRIGALDPLGADLPPGASLYPSLMRRLAGSLVRCLTGAQGHG